MKSDISEEHNRLFLRMKDSEKEYNRMKQENIELRAKFQRVSEKEESEKKYRQELEKVFK